VVATGGLVITSNNGAATGATTVEGGVLTMGVVVGARFSVGVRLSMGV